MMKQIVVALFFGLLLAGCVSETPEPVKLTPAMENRNQRPPMPISKPFSEKILVGKIRETVTNDGYRNVQVPVKNLTKESLKVLYRFRWYDANGMDVPTPNQDMWKSLVIIAKEEIVLSASAPGKNCLDVKLLIKEAVQK